ncbi:acylphosphatase [Bisgaard Taxon 45]
MLKKQFFIYGLVQGVGFRYFTWKTATQIGVKGYVRNRQDGSVEVVATGTDTQLAQLSAWLNHGPRTASVEQVIEQDYADSHVFSDFAVRY